MILHQNILICFVGTYTKDKSKGIYRINFNINSRKVEKVELSYEIENPTYLSIDKERHILYTSCKINGSAGVASFKYWEEQDKLNLLNYNLCETNQPCHISACTDKQILLSSNYHENKMIVYNTLEGIILNYPLVRSHENETITPHIHCAMFTFDREYIVAVDLGLDKLFVYQLVNNELILKEDLNYSFPVGTGPRHIVYCNAKYYYVLSEFTSEVFVFKYDNTSDNVFENIQVLSSLPKDYTGAKSGAAIRIHPNKKYLYTSDRGNNSISLFYINSSDGRLKYVETFSCNGDSPRDFQIDPSGCFLFCANEASNSISIYSINQSNGSLKFICTEGIANPTCIEFV